MTVALTVAAYHAATMSSPVSPSRLHLAFQGLRLRLRGSDLWFIALALLVGLIAGYLTLLQSGIARWLQGTLYGLDDGMRLSSLPSLTWTALLVLPLGGLLVGLVSLAATRLKRPLLDAVEANALHGGRMSMRDNLIVLTQTLLSNGCGASVGLEASYTQMGAGSGSQLGRVMRLRRNDVRILVGAGAAGAIAAAFGAPLAGAFYAFEIVIGAYTPLRWHRWPSQRWPARSWPTRPASKPIYCQRPRPSTCAPPTTRSTACWAAAARWSASPSCG